jgi:class 3 adenylate cyclase/tetratricopeptide (TPR) repeat protein
MIECPSCGSPNAREARFCQACGASLGPDEPAREERKLVSVLFVDLVGFTARSERTDPEDVRDSLQLYYGTVKAQIERYGGTVEKFIGDAVMAVFGAPISHGDDAERAVRASLRVLEAIEELNRAHPGLDLAIRAAVNTGEAVVSVGSGHDPGDALATGDVVNTASRLQTGAPPGSIVVGEETHRATRHVIRYEPIPAIDAKGKSEPVAAWLAIEPLAAPAERPLAGTKLVGRARELEVIASIWARATEERRPHLITVIGPAGIGKSRLSHEVADVVGRAGGRSFWGRCLPYEERAAYHAFGEVLKQVADIYETDPVAASREKLAGAVRSLLSEPEAAETTRFLSLLLGLGLDEPTDERRLVFFAARRVLERLADQGPILLIMEDVHWSDATQLDLLEYLASHVRDAPIVFLVLARPEFLEQRPTWGTGILSQTTIPLEPLTPDQSSEVARALLSSADPGSVDRLVALAEGNPLFLEELAASLIESGSVDRLPTTVRAAIASRIDALPGPARAVLFDASVIGQTFWRGVLGHLAHKEDVDIALEALEDRDLIRRRPSSVVEGDVEFSFKHMTIREVAYATIPRAERRREHAAVAAFIESTIGGRAELAGILAHHWREAGEPVRAIDHLLRAAERAREGLATDETYELYSLALELAPDEGTATRVRLQRALALAELEDFERAAAGFAEVEPLLEGRDLAEALLAHGRAATWTEKTEESLALAERALALVDAEHHADLIGPATARVAVAHGMRADEGDIDRALVLGDLALDRWAPGTRTLELAEHYHMHADVHYWTGSLERAAELSRAARELSGDPHSAEALLRGGGLEALALSGMGRYEEAIVAFDATIAKARELGRTVGVLLNYSTAAYRDILDLSEARVRSEEALTQVVRWSGFSMPTMNSRTDLIATALLEGDVGAAQTAWPGAWEDALSARAWTRWLIAGRLAAARAEIALHAESPDAAVGWAERSLELATRTHRAKYGAVSRTLLGRALLAAGRHEDGLAQLRRGAAEADRLGMPWVQVQSHAALATALDTSDPDAARSSYAAATSIIRRVAEELEPGRAARYLAAPAVADVLSLAT